jgi:hypothetical protein
MFLLKRKSVIQVPDFKLGYFVFLGFRRRSCSATETT